MGIEQTCHRLERHVADTGLARQLQKCIQRTHHMWDTSGWDNRFRDRLSLWEQQLRAQKRRGAAQRAYNWAFIAAAKRRNTKYVVHAAHECPQAVGNIGERRASLSQVGRGGHNLTASEFEVLFTVQVTLSVSRDSLLEPNQCADILRQCQ